MQRAITALNDGSLATAINQLASTSNPTLVTNLYNKMRGGFENYYLAGARYTWTSYGFPERSLSFPKAATPKHPAAPASCPPVSHGYDWPTSRPRRMVTSRRHFETHPLLDRFPLWLLGQ